MEKQTKINAFMLALIVVAGIVGVTVDTNTTAKDITTAPELSGFYICNVTMNVSQWARISGTGVTGYPFMDSMKGQKYCGPVENRGVWMNLAEYAEQIGIDPYELLIEKEPEPEPRRSIIGPDKTIETCNQWRGCIEIER